MKDKKDTLWMEVATYFSWMMIGVTIFFTINKDANYTAPTSITIVTTDASPQTTNVLTPTSASSPSKKTEPAPKKQTWDAFHREKKTNAEDMSMSSPDPVEAQSASYEDLIGMGIDHNAAKNWVKYLEAGGKIQTPEDVFRIYGMTSKNWEKVRDHIYFAPQDHKSKLPTIRQFEVNSATAEDWQRIKGIGPVLSQRIVKFRNLLGGFVSIHQIKETYGVSDSLFKTFEGLLELNPNIKTLDINQADESTLSAHPYITFKQAKIIVKYRTLHGPFNQQEELMKTQIVDSAWLVKMNPYLSFSLH